MNQQINALRICAVLSLLSSLITHADSTIPESKQPNIIVIYTDDQGYGDVSALNPEAKFKTPNLDTLVNEGVAFTNGHSSDTVCTPSRYGLLTGRYAWRTSLKSGVFGSEAPCLIPDGRMTLASMLKENGYHTAMVGKWHLGMSFPGKKGSRDWSQPVTDMPLDKGFDYFYGIPASLNFGILAWFEGRHAAVPPTLFTNKKKNPRYVDYRIMPPYNKGSGNSEEYISAKMKGFEVAPDFIDNQCLTRFTDKSLEWMEGKAADAKAGKPFFLYLPYTSPHYPVCPLPEFQGQGEAGAYGEFMIETDYHVGRILKFLKEQELDENTLIIYTSDNGPEKSWRERIKETGHDSRGGFQGGKRSPYEGGHRVPFLVRWPSSIKQPGRTCNKLIGQTDLLATLAELVGADKLPDNAGEDSQSFAKLLFGNDADFERLPLINRGQDSGSYAITEGNWKLILPGRSRKELELYDLANDPEESTNVAAKHAQKVAELQEKITAIVAKGRTTPGAVQPNDTGYWKELTWMTKEEYIKSSLFAEQQPSEVKKVEKHSWTLGFKPDESIIYNEPANGEPLKLDCFYPVDHSVNDNRGCIIFFFGGGWSGGDTKQFYGYCKYFSSRGLVAISAQYRTKKSHQAEPRDCVEDGKEVIRYVRANAKKLGINPDQIIVGGGSAGGHVAASTAMCPKFDGSPQSSISCVPNALILFNPIYDNGPESYGHSRVLEYWEDISPMHNIVTGLPPTITFFGDQDAHIPLATINTFQNKMENAGNQCETHIYEGQKHGFFHINKGGKEMFIDVITKADAFLVKNGYLSGEGTAKNWTMEAITDLLRNKTESPKKQNNTRK